MEPRDFLISPRTSECCISCNRPHFFQEAPIKQFIAAQRTRGLWFYACLQHLCWMSRHSSSKKKPTNHFIPFTMLHFNWIKTKDNLAGAQRIICVKCKTNCGAKNLARSRAAGPRGARFSSAAICMWVAAGVSGGGGPSPLAHHAPVAATEVRAADLRKNARQGLVHYANHRTSSERFVLNLWAIGPTVHASEWVPPSQVKAESVVAVCFLSTPSQPTRRYWSGTRASLASRHTHTHTRTFAACERRIVVVFASPSSGFRTLRIIPSSSEVSISLINRRSL